jgi:hypothetical protein
MRNLKLGSAVATCASVALAVACSNGVDSSRLAPTGLRTDVVPSTGSAGIATLCKNGPAGTYTFTVANSGTTNAGDNLVAAPSITVVTPGTAVCTNVFTRTTGSSADAPAILAITENAAPGTDLQSITLSGPGAQAGSVDVPGRKATVYINLYHGDVASFVNVAVVHPGHCTYTQGWYKNHTSSWPSGTLKPTTVWDGWKTIIDLFNTPPKGSQYIILAHQYITALLNIQGGSSVTPEVQAALDKAAAYFIGGGAGAGDPSVDISGVSTILDNYNNGLVGPGHCD